MFIFSDGLYLYQTPRTFGRTLHVSSLKSVKAATVLTGYPVD